MLKTNASFPKLESTRFDLSISPAQFAGLLTVLFLALFPSVIFGTGTFFYRDYGVLAYPTLAYAHDSFWSGSIPLWNPYSNCGAPFLAQWGTMVLYPFSLFYLLLPIPWSANVFCIGHLVWAGLGMFILARRWLGRSWPASVAGTTFVFNGVTLSCLMWPNYCVALGWMPWVVLAGDRAWSEGTLRSWVLAAAAAACQLMAGVPELVLLTWTILAGLWIFEACSRPERRARLLAGGLLVVVLAATLAAAQLLPFFELLAHSQRDATAATGKWALPWTGWGDFLLPFFRCAETPQGMFFQLSQDFFASNYLGLLPTVLALAAIASERDRRLWLLAGLSAFCLCLSAGENGFVYRALRAVLPGVGFVRYPVKFVLMLGFAVPLLAGYALRKHATHPHSDRHAVTDLVTTGQQTQNTPDAVIWRRILILSIVATLGLVALLGLTWAWPTRYEQWPVVWHSAAWRVAFLLVALALLQAQRLPHRTQRATVASLGFLTVLVADSVIAVPQKNPVLPASYLAPGLWQEQHPGAELSPGQGRVFIQPAAEEQLLVSQVRSLEADFLGKRLALWSHLNLLDRIPKVNGSSTLQIREEKQLESTLYDTKPSQNFPQLERFLGVTFRTAPEQVLEWTRLTNALPWVTIGQQPVFAGPIDTLRALTNSAFEPAREVYLPLEARGAVRAERSAAARVESVRVTPERIEFTTSSPTPAVTVVAQSFYRVWRAWIDDQPASLWRANYAFQALEVPAGQHVVRLVYRDERFWIGLFATGVSVAVCGLLWFWGEPGRRRGDNHAGVEQD